MGWLDLLDADSADPDLTAMALEPASRADPPAFSVACFHHDASSALVLPPGADALEHQLACADPLMHLDAYGFPCFVFRSTDGCLVDLDGDGVFDCTSWGTPVERVEGYVRADGTEVRDHYRTVADGRSSNNLRR